MVLVSQPAAKRVSAVCQAPADRNGVSRSPVRAALGTFDHVFGNPLCKRALHAVFGYSRFHVFVHLARYRACHMVSAGETCLLAGIFNRRTVEDYSRVVGATGRVIVVEAHPRNVETLRASVQASNVVYVNKAVWNRRGTAEFLASAGEEQGYNRLSDPQMNVFPYHLDRQPRTIEVATDTLDAIAREVAAPVIHHINLTINGAELQALDGISEILEGNEALRMYINTEYPAPAQAVLEKLRRLGFKVFTSGVIRTVNKQIRLRRVYAVHQA